MGGGHERKEKKKELTAVERRARSYSSCSGVVQVDTHTHAQQKPNPHHLLYIHRERERSTIVSYHHGRISIDPTPRGGLYKPALALHVQLHLLLCKLSCTNIQQQQYINSTLHCHKNVRYHLLLHLLVTNFLLYIIANDIFYDLFGRPILTLIPR